MAAKIINEIFNEPNLETLKRLPNEYIDCVITSPPYWNLRDYGYDGQWGQEPTYQDYLNNLWDLMDELHRVLKTSGTIWINLGDTYSSNKQLLLLPHRFAIGCSERGWIIRNDIIWAKRNAMPESVTDRFSKKHEYMFFMVKSKDYYFDLDSVRIKYDHISKTNKSTIHSKYDNIDIEIAHRQGMHKQRGYSIIEKRPNLPSQKAFVNFLKARVSKNVIIESTEIPKTTIDHWYRTDKAGFSYPSIEHWNEIKHLLDNWDSEFYEFDASMTYVEYETDDINKNAQKGKNPSDVSDFWDIPNKPSSHKHFATYNDRLLINPILAGCPEGGIIYDPFMGSGSTAEAAIRSNRNYIGSEMSMDYYNISQQRLNKYKTQLRLL